MFFDQHDGKLGLMYSKENLACPLMLFNATIPLYDVDYVPDTYEEACQQIVSLKRRIRQLEQRDEEIRMEIEQKQLRVWWYRMIRRIKHGI